MVFRSWIISSCLLLCASATPLFAQGGEPWEKPAFSASPEEVRQAASALSSSSQAEATVFLDETKFKVFADGRLLQTRHLVYRIEAKEAVDNWSVIASRWQPWFQKKPSLQARVIEADGRVFQLDEKTLTDSPSRETSQDTFTDDRIYKGPLPGVAIGSIVEELITLEDEQAFFPAGSVYRVAFGRSVPVLKSRLVLEAPSAFSLRYKVRLLPEVTAEKEQKDGETVLRFEQGKMEALDPPQEMLPYDVPERPQVEFSTGESWRSISETYAKLAEPQIQPQAVASLLPSDLTGSRDEVLAKLAMALHSKIRYTGIEFGEAKITPQSPAEVLKRHYGDCKDKAAFLVSMLRAAKIPAYLALLSTGPGQDVHPDLPGMSLFDHAIVYVPGGADHKDDRWIDATADTYRIGVLPMPDQGRRALIIGLENVQLLTTPKAKPLDNLLVENREFHLADFGPSQVIERSEPNGSVDASYRAYYGSVDGKETSRQFEDYVKQVYLADSVSGFVHGDGHNLLKPFQLTLTIEKAKRGSSDLNEAAVAMPLGGLYNRLPKWFFQKDEDEENKKSDSSAKTKKDRTDDFIIEPFVTEWRYIIKPAKGFIPRAVPADKTIEMGPAKLTQHYEQMPDGGLKGILRFDTLKDRYTVAEAKALRKAIDDLNRMQVPMLYFNHQGMALLNEGKVKEALEYNNKLVQDNGKDALSHVRLAMTLLQAGVGEKARAEAEKATQLDPKSALAWRILAWVAQHDGIAQRFSGPFDWKTSVNAYQKAIEIEPDDIGTYFNLAVVYEYAPDGERYGPHSQLDEAAKTYQIARDKYKADTQSADYANNMLFDLFYARHFDQVQKEIDKVPPSPATKALAIASIAAMSGSKAALAEADKINGDMGAKAKALNDAGQYLISLRFYSEAAELLAANVQGEGDSTLRARQVEIFRSLTPYDKVLFPKTDPRSVLQQFHIAVSEGTLGEKVKELFSKNFMSPKDFEKAKKSFDQLHGYALVEAETSGLPRVVLLDLALGKTTYSVDGDDEIGYRIVEQPIAENPRTVFVVKENGAYKLENLGGPDEDVGRQIMELISQNKLQAAQKWLDWSRDMQEKGGGEDSLAGPLLPRFWTVGEKGSAEKVRLAAASLLAVDEDIKPYLPLLKEARAKTNDKEERTNLDLVLATAYRSIKNWKDLYDVSFVLLKDNPDSNIALEMLAMAAKETSNWKDWDAAANSRLAKHPNEKQVLRLMSQAAVARGDYAQGVQYLKTLQDSGKGDFTDLNGMAWLSLFTGKITQHDVDMSQQSNMQTQNKSYATLHTLACLYAEVGKTVEARQVIAQAMKASSLRQPDEDAWYVFGRVYEQYGLNDAALVAYNKVEKPEDMDNTASTYELARLRVQNLEKRQQRASSSASK